MKLHRMEHVLWARFEKSRPGWMRKRFQWQHGIEYPEYVELCGHEDAGIPVRIEIREKLSPMDPERESDVAPMGTRLWVTLADVRTRGMRMPKWPDGLGGPSGEGGWLWPRNIMHDGRADSPAPVQGRLF